jgi:hypothetical protein
MFSIARTQPESHQPKRADVYPCVCGMSIDTRGWATFGAQSSNPEVAKR